MLKQMEALGNMVYVFAANPNPASPIRMVWLKVFTDYLSGDTAMITSFAYYGNAGLYHFTYNTSRLSQSIQGVSREW